MTVAEQFQFRTEGYIQLERRDAEQLFGGKWTRLAESLEPDALMIENVSDPGEFSDLIHLAQGGITVLCGVRRFNFDRTLRTLLSLDVDPFILARVTRLVMHQRLVNLLCLECRRPVPAKPSLRMVGEKYRAHLERIIEESCSSSLHCERCRGRVLRENGARGASAVHLAWKHRFLGHLVEESWAPADEDLFRGAVRGGPHPGMVTTTRFCCFPIENGSAAPSFPKETQE